MTQSRKRSIFTLMIWGVVQALFVGVFFFAGSGPATFTQDKPRFVMIACIFIAGYAIYFSMMRTTRVSKDQRPLLVDERDERIARQASSYAFVSLLIFIYLVCILLHLSYEESGWMPVGWMWFLGYSSIFMGYILHSIIYLTLDSRMILYGES